MGSEDYEVFKELKQERRQKLEDPRYQYALETIEKNGFKVEASDRQKMTVKIEREGLVIAVFTFWPYTGWYQGVGGPAHGRGLRPFLSVLKAMRKEGTNGII